MIKTKYIECACSHPNHVVRIVHWDDPIDPKEDIIAIELQLNNSQNFFQRVLNAIKYVFKMNNTQWEETVLKKSQIGEIIEFLKRYQQE